MTAPLTPVHSEPSWQDHQDPSATAATCSSSSSSSDTFINFFQLGVSPFAYGADVGSLDLHQLLDSSYCLPLLQLHHHHHHQQQQQQQQQSSHFALPPLSSIDTVTPYFGTTDLFSVPPSASASPMPPYPPYPRLIESKVVSLQTKSQSPEVTYFPIPPTSPNQQQQQQKQQQQQQIHSITSPMDTFLTKPLKPARAHMEAGGKRFRPTKAQVDWLKRKFEETPNPKSDEMRRLSDESGIEILKLRVWFQNKRTRSK